MGYVTRGPGETGECLLRYETMSDTPEIQIASVSCDGPCELRLQLHRVLLVY